MGIFDFLFGSSASNAPTTTTSSGGSSLSAAAAAVLGPAIPLIQTGTALAQQGVFGPVPQIAANVGGALGVTPFVGSSNAKPPCTTCGGSPSLVEQAVDFFTAPLKTAVTLASNLPDLSLVRLGDNVQGNQTKGVSNVALIAGAAALLWYLSRGKS